MARPNSRYFSPVIKKLLEAKKNENIVIDPSFKASLRAQVLAKASGTVMHEARDTGGFDFARISEIFTKFRYQLAIVPSVLLLVVVAVSALNMPAVKIKSDVTVPVVTVTVEADQALTEQAAETDFSTDLAMTSMVVDEPKIKTFPGRSVLPASYFEKTSEQLQFNPELPVTTKIAPVSEPAVLDPKIMPMPTVYTYVPDQTEPEPSVANSVDQHEDLAQQSEISVEENNDEAAEDRYLPQVMVDSERPVMEVPVNLNYVPAQKVAEQEVYYERYSEQSEDEQQEIEQRKVLPVYYNSDFSEDEKTVFEQGVIAGLVDDKEVSYVSVSVGSDRVVTVEVHLAGGEQEVTYFMKDGGDGWNQVRYTQNYYYDDSLSYEPSMRYVDYNSYRYPQEY